MDIDLNVLNLASALTRHATARQRVIAENVAHADTPGYKARDVVDFATMLEDRIPAFDGRATRPGHLDFGAVSGGVALRETTVLGAESPNGNTVSLEDQMMRAAQVRQDFDLATGVYRKSMDILRMSLGK
jgi:flagellar basal-body rod protein FlgB